MKEKPMTNRANIFYDHEIENIVRNRSVGVLSLLDHLFTQYPGASKQDIFYTVESHVLTQGMDELPNTLLQAPQETVEEIPQEEFVPVAPEVSEDIEEIEKPVARPVENDDEEGLTPREKTIRARRRRVGGKTEEKPREKVNVRNIFDEIDDLQL